MIKLPYLTADLPGIGGQIKSIPEDFYVEEIPLYQASGEGSHTYLTFAKEGLTTLAAINRIAQSLGVSSRHIGYAGLKDAHAVTQQTISIADVPPERVQNLHLSDIKVLTVSRHRNKMKVGHLAGNKFVIKIRGVTEQEMAAAEAIVAQLQQAGVPNYFGQQRFGTRGNSHRLGLALVKSDLAEFLAEFLGRPQPNEYQQAQQARVAFDEGRLADALELWPRSLRNEWFVLRQLVESGSQKAAMRALHRNLKRLLVSACQSDLFNRLLAQRLATLSMIEVGDVAYIHRNRAAFLVTSIEAEQPRVDSFEISPAGPLFGSKYLVAEGGPGERERAVLVEADIQPEAFNVPGVKLKGARRPYRMPLTEVTLSWDDGIVIAFALPPGGYATMVLREIMKNDAEGEMSG